MGYQDIHEEAAECLPEKGSEGGLAAYNIVRYPGAVLPEQYENYVFANWKRSLRHGNDYFRLIKAAAYYTAYELYVRRLISQPSATVRLAVLAEDSDVLLGFSICRGHILDYIFVSSAYRRLGVGRSLVPADIDTITHLTKTGMTIWGSKCKGWEFNPFA